MHSRIRQLLPALVLALVAAPALVAQNTGTIQGRVTVEGIGRPLPQAQVGVVGFSACGMSRGRRCPSKLN